MISEKINQLPQHIRDYIHDLESMCPADLVQENAFLKESIEALLRKGRKMSDTITQECKCCETDGDCINGLCMSCARFTHNLERHYDEARRKLVSMKEQRDELLEVCKRSKTYLATLPGKYGIECRHLFAELKAIIAKCEKG